MTLSVISKSLLVALLLAVLAPTAHSQRWSHDGAWLAYRHESTAQTTAPTDAIAWLIPRNVRPESHALAAREDALTPPQRRIWATRVADRESVLIEDGRADLTEPSWTRLSTGLYFARLTPASGHSRLELVIKDAVDRETIVASRSIAATKFVPSERSDALWSPDGAHLVAPRVDPPGLWIVRIPDGKTIHEIPSASRAAWSPDGWRLAFIEDVRPPRLCILDLRAGEMRRLTEYPGSQRVPAPIWGRDGQVIHYVLETEAPTRGRDETGPSLRLAAIRIQPLKQERSLSLNESAQGADDALLACSLAFDGDGNNLFSTARYASQPSVINWIRTGNGEIHNRISPFHESVPLLGLTVSPIPGDYRLAVRVAADGVTSAPAICDPDSESFAPIIPDESARANWLKSIASAVSDVLDDLREESTESDWNQTHPTSLPLPGELAESSRERRRLRRLALLGRTVADASVFADVTSEDADDLTWARLVFDYLLSDSAAVLNAIDRIEESTLDPETRLRLLGFRAQTLLLGARYDQAGVIVDYLHSQVARAGQVVEESPATGGRTLSSLEAVDDFAWIGALDSRIKELRDRRALSGESSLGFEERPELDAAFPESEVEERPRRVPPPPPPMIGVPRRNPETESRPRTRPGRAPHKSEDRVKDDLDIDDEPPALLRRHGAAD